MPVDEKFLKSIEGKAIKDLTAQEKIKIMAEINNKLNETTSKMQKDIWMSNLETNLETIQKSKNFLQLPPLDNNSPVILLAHGPSRKKNMHLLKDTKIPIFCCNKTLKELLKYTKPMYVFAVDGREDVVSSIPDEGTEDLTLVCPAVVHPKVLEKWKGEIYFFNTDFSWTDNGIKNEDIVRMTGISTVQVGGNVGATMWQFARFLGSRLTILVGYDMGYGTELPTLTDEYRKSSGLRCMNMGDRKVWTDYLWITYQRWMVHAFSLFPHITVINATEGGNLYWTEAGGCNIIPMSLKSVVEGLGKID